MSAFVADLVLASRSIDDPSARQQAILERVTAWMPSAQPFLIDSHGLPVVVPPILPPEVVSAVGAYVTALISIVEAMGLGEPRLTGVKLKDRWLTGVALPDSGLRLCLLSEKPVEPLLYAATDLVTAGWQELLDWSLGSQRGRSCFVLDGRGLLVASIGDVSERQAAAIGARLTVAFERTERMRPLGMRAESFAIEFPGCWVTGFHVRVSNPRALTMAILGPEPVRGEAGAAIRRALREQLARGWPRRGRLVGPSAESD